MRKTIERYAFRVGDAVTKDGGDYVFHGWIMMRGHKRSGVARYAVENAEGLVHIFNKGQLQLGHRIKIGDKRCKTIVKRTTASAVRRARR